MIVLIPADLGGVNQLGVLRVLLSILFVIDCVALTVVVLMQEGKSQGLGALSGATDSYWGKNKGRTMEGGLVRFTTMMGIAFFVLAILLNIIG